MKAIINLSKNGQLCNRLFYTGKLYALALENDSEYYDASLIQYFDGFENRTIIRKCLGLDTSNPIISKLIWIVGVCFPGLVGRLKFVEGNGAVSVRAALESVANRDYVLVKGWHCHGGDLLSKYRSQILKHYSLRTSIYKKINDLLPELKRDGKRLVGFHFRAGDYRTFKNGTWFVDLEQYIKYARHLVDKHHCDVVFVSNENISDRLSSEENISYFSGSMYEDLCLLSNCDILVGVKSTYLYWAAYLGELPIIYIDNVSYGDIIGIQHHRIWDTM